MKTKLLVGIFATLVVIIAVIKEYAKYSQPPMQRCIEETSREFNSLDIADRRTLDLLIKVKAIKTRKELIIEYCKDAISEGEFK